MLQFKKILSTHLTCEWGALSYDLFFNIRYDYTTKHWFMNISRYVSGERNELLARYQMPKADALAHLQRRVEG